VLLMHGLGMSADSWIMHAQELTDSLPLNLAHMGYDVYVGNFRGTWDYSFHKTFDKTKDKEFWDFGPDGYLIDLQELVTFVDKKNKL
jgi:pimeloyl-ACP methyl ester carboxylesterase